MSALPRGFKALMLFLYSPPFVEKFSQSLSLPQENNIIASSTIGNMPFQVPTRG